MAKTFRPGLVQRIANAVTSRMAKRGKGPSYIHVLSVPGRRTGAVHSTPVDVIEVGGRKYLVGPYGLRDWVRNARAAGEVTLSRGGRSDTYRVTEVNPPEAVPVLRKYIEDIKFTRSYFDARPDSPDEVIAADAKNHPVLRLDQSST